MPQILCVYPADYPHIFIAKQHHSVRLLEKQEGFEDWEGLMCRDGSASYDYKRSLHLLKLKEFFVFCSLGYLH